MSDRCINDVVGGWMEGGSFLNGIGDEVLRESADRVKVEEQHVG